MITTKRTSTRRAARGSATGSATPGGGAIGFDTGARGVPRRALADGVVERRRTPRAPQPEPQHPAPWPVTPEDEAPIATTLSAREHYRLELERRSQKLSGDLQSLLAEAKAEYEAQLAAPRPAGKGGRPKKKKSDEFQLEPMGDDTEQELG